MAYTPAYAQLAPIPGLTSNSGGGSDRFPFYAPAPSQVYGSRPSGAGVPITAGENTGAAMAAGNQVYNQLPQYATSLTNIGGNVASETAGQLPEDVVTQLKQRAAERGVATGTSGSDNDNAAYLRALGLTSLDLTNMGQTNLLRQLTSLPGAQTYENASFYPTSGQQYESSLQSNIFAAAPDPAAAGNANLRAAQAGYGVGRGSMGGGLPPTPSYSSGGTSGGGGYSVGLPSYGSGVNQGQTGSPSQDVIDRILASYSGTVGFGGSGAGGGTFYAGDQSGDPFADTGESNYGDPNDYYPYSMDVAEE